MKWLIQSTILLLSREKAADLRLTMRKFEGRENPLLARDYGTNVRLPGAVNLAFWRIHWPSAAILLKSITPLA
jgi:hypothetical protein